jgi:hypothetical protein
MSPWRIRTGAAGLSCPFRVTYQTAGTKHSSRRRLLSMTLFWLPHPLCGQYPPKAMTAALVMVDDVGEGKIAVMPLFVAITPNGVKLPRRARLFQWRWRSEKSTRGLSVSQDRHHPIPALTPGDRRRQPRRFAALDYQSICRYVTKTFFVC